MFRGWIRDVFHDETVNVPAFVPVSVFTHCRLPNTLIHTAKSRFVIYFITVWASAENCPGAGTIFHGRSQDIFAMTHRARSLL